MSGNVKTAIISVLISVVLSLSGAWAANVAADVRSVAAEQKILRDRVVQLEAERAFFAQMLMELRVDVKAIRDAMSGVTP